jgi:small subunit ribosomal protein S18
MGYQGSRSRSGGRFQSHSRFRRRRRFCGFCVDKVNIDYKDHDSLRRHVNEYGRIKPRRQTGSCAKHQRKLAVAVKRARHLALLPFVLE